MKVPTEKEKKNARNIMAYAGLGAQWIILLGLGAWGGVKLDERLGTRPLGVVVLPLLALVVCFYQLFKMLNKK